MKRHGFTLIEMLAVMAILATLVLLAAPKYFDAVDRAREAGLRTNLRLLREALDKHQADTGRLPDTLQQLAQSRYLRSVPVDPVTDSADTWVVVPAPDGITPGVHDVRSGAPGIGRDGSPYSSW